MSFAYNDSLIGEWEASPAVGRMVGMFPSVTFDKRTHF